MLLIQPFVYSLIVYFGIGVTIRADLFFIFYLTLLLVVFSGSALGYLVSSLFGKPETAVMVSPLILLPLMLFGGLFSNVGTIV